MDHHTVRHRLPGPHGVAHRRRSHQLRAVPTAGGGDVTRVQPWVVRMVEEVMGGSPLEIGRRYEHPQDGEIEITGGQYWGEHGISNFWYWRVLASGEIHHGYGGDWPEKEQP
jgi:hypothetical protein